MLQVPIDNITLGFTFILILGVMSQWVSWRLRVPSIVALMVCGVLIGPLAGWMNPDELFGEELVRAIVSIGVAVILFEGGLSLRFRELAGNQVVWRLVGIGILVTAGSSAVLAHLLFGFSWQVAALFGAILSVTGPTVIVPLLRHLRLTEGVGVALKWEGILNDPIGAICAVLIFEAVILSPAAGSAAAGELAWGLAYSALLGMGTSAVGTLVVVSLFYKSWVPDYLRSPVMLGVVLGVFEASNLLREESGLLAVTVMGVMLANQPWVRVKKIAQFKETLSLVLIGFLFVLLSARVTMEHLKGLGWAAFAFLGALILVVRPLAVFLSTIGSSLTWPQRLFLATICPRGIVAAAVVSAFAVDSGLPVMEDLVPLTFFVIAWTVVVSGLTSPWLSKVMGMRRGKQGAVLLLGGAPWVRDLAETLREAGFDVRLAADNWFHVNAARMAGVPSQHLNIMKPDAIDELNRADVGLVLALEHNGERNALALERLSEVFDRTELFMLQPEDPGRASAVEKPEALARGSEIELLFESGVDFGELAARHRAGWRFKATPLTERFDVDAYLAEHGQEALILFWIVEGQIEPHVAGKRPEKAERVVGLVPPMDKQTDRLVPDHRTSAGASSHGG